MTFEIWAALAVVCITVYGLLKRWETRLVLLTSGFAMCLLALDPIAAFKQFDKSMTNASLIVVVCSAMGFARVMNITGCDLHLVRLLTKPLNRLGIALLPCCMIVTGVVSIAIGMCAAIGPTICALMIRAGFRPAMAACTVIASTLPSFWSPGSSHNGFVAKIADWPIMDYLTYTGTRTLLISIVCIIVMVAACLLFGDYKKGGFENDGVHDSENKVELPEKANLLWAFAPLLPVILLFVVAIGFPQVKVSVATAMLIGVIYTMIVTRVSPADLTKRFFDGMGQGYGSILGLIIAAGVFAAGLRSCGVIDVFVEALKGSSDLAKLGAAVGPYVLGVMTGSGDAAAFAFNEAVTPHAASFGMTIPDLGYLASVAATFGRVSSPLAAGVIVISGIAGVSPIEVIKRSAPVQICTLAFLFFIS
ncbi:C4-dicarboxylate transporter DcuC [Sutterella wadsworthensis]|uniref:C4-dicarboxylate transporter DcuC n=1 Tax=Sutterella wadsworthensis TaxID=40545 RepID=UPI0013F62661|nr:C4-dicarboxylate transporter DcuC [Sutterella wadsworthensis]